MYVVQFISQNVVISNILIGATTLLSFVILVCGQVDILSCSLENFIYTTVVTKAQNIPYLK